MLLDHFIQHLANYIARAPQLFSADQLVIARPLL